MRASFYRKSMQLKAPITILVLVVILSLMNSARSLVVRLLKEKTLLNSNIFTRLTTPLLHSLYPNSYSSISTIRSFSSLRLSSSAEEGDDATMPVLPSKDDREKSRNAILKKISTMKVVKLRDILKRHGCTPKSNMRKGDLIEACVQVLLDEYEAHKSVALKNQRVPVRTRKTTPDQIHETVPTGIENIPAKAARRARTLRPIERTFDDDYDSNMNTKYNDMDSDDMKTLIVDKGYKNYGRFGERNNQFNFPYGDQRNMRLDNVGGADMDITFLGTASCIPSITRGVSCMALRLNSDVWMFDCGESSQVQLQKSRVKASKIRKIFLTHAHGDHSFGLPGVLCLMGQSTQSERDIADPGDDILEPIDIYGPEGTRDLIRAVVQLSYSRVVAPHRIHELKGVPNLHRYKTSPRPTIRTRFDPNYGEREGSRDIYPDKNGCYHLFEEGGFTVSAAPMQHTVPCVGYVVTEKDKPGTLKADDIGPIVERNKDLLKKQLKLADVNKAYAVLKNIKQGEHFTFPDGTTLSAEEIVEPPKKGRKIVILGDTCNSDMIADLAQDADVLVHEATNAWIKEFDLPRIASELALEKDTFNHGHSTPQMAGKFARKINAKRLILTHFSPRYRGGDDFLSMKVMWKLEDFARSTCRLMGKNDVIAAWDHMILPVGQGKRSK